MSELKKGFTIDCDFNGRIMSINFYVGTPYPGTNPIHHQSLLVNSRGGVIPKYITDRLSKIQEIAEYNRIPFDETFFYIEQEISFANIEKEEFEKFLNSMRINSGNRNIR